MLPFWMKKGSSLGFMGSHDVGEGFFAKSHDDGLLEDAFPDHLLFFEAFDPLCSVSSDVDSVANGIIFVVGVGALQEADDVFHDVFVEEGEVFSQDPFFFFGFGKVEINLWLQAAVDVFGDLKSRGVVVHGDADPEFGMGCDF